MNAPPWPLLHVTELADVCHTCLDRPATWTDADDVNWCARCWTTSTTTEVAP